MTVSAETVATQTDRTTLSVTRLMLVTMALLKLRARPATYALRPSGEIATNRSPPWSGILALMVFPAVLMAARLSP